MNGLNTEDGFVLLGLESRMEWSYGTSFFMWLAGFLLIARWFISWYLDILLSGLVFYKMSIPKDSGGICKGIRPRMPLPLHLICQAYH